MAMLFKKVADRVKSAWAADVPCWFDYLHETAPKK